ncbi:hypothetical protein FOPG_19516 [Fusarium oxysporum f. sp. conglutinans race 2 54008]|uniref:Secreted protein n=1 Tax=Fusarium oxysporum f. sp. conglutinans race 2 54008 TaxID=1089457 RepID=X0HSR0_FUSOX|nr:hypothetical protein FOPG_19516 [Fusarium oxysporum f. sp. conglutinans race 2 54008]
MRPMKSTSLLVGVLWVAWSRSMNHFHKSGKFAAQARRCQSCSMRERGRSEGGKKSLTSSHQLPLGGI